MRKRAAGSDGSPIAHAARAAVRRRDLRFPCASGADPDRNLGHFRIERPQPNQPSRLMTNRRAIPRRLNGAAAPDCIAAKLRPLEFTTISLMLR